jgi:hypothetical protein
MKPILPILVLGVSNLVPASLFAGTNDFLVPGDNLVVEGVPKIPMQPEISSTASPP